MKTLDQFIKDYEGKSKGYPTDSQYKGECLSIVKIYIKECFGIDPPPSGTNSAYGYWSNFPTPLGTVFEKVAKTATNFPGYGDVPIWKPTTTNPYGHIDLCVDKKADKDGFAGMDQNWGIKTFERIGHDYKNVVGWLTPKNKPVSNSDNMTEEQKRILDFIGNRTEGEVRQAFGALADLPNVTKEIEDLKASQKDLVSRIEQLEADAKANNDLITDYQSQLSTAKSTESKLQAD